MGGGFGLRHAASGRLLRIDRRFRYSQENCGMGCAVVGELEVSGVREVEEGTRLVVSSGLFLQKVEKGGDIEKDGKGEDL